METNYLAGLLKINATCAEVSIQSYEVDDRPFVKVTGCDSNGGLMMHMEIPAAEYYQIIDQARKF